MKWKFFLVLTILGIIAGVWLVFSLIVPAPYGKLSVSAPSNFVVFVDGKPFESGTIAAGRHVVEAQYRGLVLMKQEVYVKPEENARVSFSAEGLLLYGPPNSYFAVKTSEGTYNAKGEYLWLPSFSGKAMVMINGSTLPLYVGEHDFITLAYREGALSPLDGNYYISIPMWSAVSTNTGSITLPTVSTSSLNPELQYSLDGNVVVLGKSMSTGTVLRTAVGDFTDVKIASDESMLGFTATSVSQYNIKFGWRIWTLKAPESSGTWYKSDSGFVFSGKKVWSYKDNGAWLWVHEPPGILVDVSGNNLVFLTDKGVVFWDCITGEEITNPKFDVPEDIPFVKGREYLYSSDGTWFSGVKVLNFSWNEKWVSFVSSNHDIIIVTR